MIELEVRGPLIESKFSELKNYLDNNAELLKEVNEKVLFFDTSDILSIGDFGSGSARISLKHDQKGTHLRIKEGNPSSTERKEYSIKLDSSEEQIHNTLHLLTRLGVENAFYRPTHRFDYKFKNLEITLKTNCVMGDHIEIETNNNEHLDELATFVKDHSIDLWKEEEYKNRVKSLMTNFPPVQTKTINFKDE